MDASVSGGVQKNGTAVCGIRGYTHDGMGVALAEGRAVFVPGGARGDKGLIRFTKVTAGTVYGRIERLDEPSPHRVPNDCPAYPRCGGCRFRHITYEEELRAKVERVEETLRRVGGVELCAEEVFAAPQTDGYRNKAAFPVGMDTQGEPITGFYRGRTHEIIPVDACRLQSAEANAAAGALRGWLKAGGGGSVRHLVVRNGLDSVLVCVVSADKPGKAARALAATLRERVPKLRGVVWQRHSGQGNVILGGEETCLWGQGYVEDELRLGDGEPLRFRLSAKSFCQINKPQAGRMYRKALEYAGPFSSALDLYCGTGTMTLLAARANPGAAVTGVEIVPEAVLDARENARRNAVGNVRFLEGDAEAVSQSGDISRPEVVLLDPPRKGLSPETVSAVLRMAPERIIYLSCDPATLARDVRLFSGGGYRAGRLTVADFFPRTPHVESLVLLVKGRAR